MCHPLVNILALLILAALHCLCVTAVANESKQFLNIRAPETALNAPIIFTLGAKTTLIGLYYRDGIRDVTAMQLDGDTWQPMGENGLSITQADGNFLSGFAIGSDGSPWILTYYTHPSNPARADRFFLYNLQGKRWVTVGPPDGHKANYSGESEFALIDGQTPALFYKTWNPETATDRHRVFVLRDTEWVESSLGKMIPADASIVISANRVFVEQCSGGQVTFREITELESEELPDPRFTINLPADHRYGAVYFCEGNLFAVKLYKSDSDAVLFRGEEADEKIELDELPTVDDRRIIGVRRTKAGEILVATNDLRSARVYRLIDTKHWELLGSATETSGLLDFESFRVLEDGTPIVTWECFLLI